MNENLFSVFFFHLVHLFIWILFDLHRDFGLYLLFMFVFGIWSNRWKPNFFDRCFCIQLLTLSIDAKIREKIFFDNDDCKEEDNKDSLHFNGEPLNTILCFVCFLLGFLLDTNGKKNFLLQGEMREKVKKSGRFFLCWGNHFFSFLQNILSIMVMVMVRTSTSWCEHKFVCFVPLSHSINIVD